MPTITTPDGVSVAYETNGDERGAPLLLIEGLGAQLLGWRRELCQALAPRGFRLIRFDNRDCGLSQRFPHGGYLLADMADDAIGLLDALNIEQAHIVGRSLGGMIAQELAIRRPDRVASLCLIYTAPNHSHIGLDVSSTFTRSRARTREEAIEQFIEDAALCSSPGYPPDTAWIRALGGLSFDRGYHPEGIARQLDAMGRSRDRTAALATVTAPTLILHGDGDRVIDVSGSRALANALPHATLRILSGMGHELPPALWPDLIDAITKNAIRPSVATPAA